MAKTLTDLSQLTKAILKESPPSRVEPTPAAQPAPTVSDEDREAEEVLAYFSRTPQNAPRSLRVAPGAGAGEDRTAELKAALEYPPGRRPAAKRAATRGAKDAALDAIAEEKAEADERIAELEQQLAAEREAHEAAVRERDRLQGECGRLRGELRKCGENAPVVAPVVAAPVARVQPTKPTQGILVAPATAAEVFPGEVREQVVATLLDGLGTAERSGRERRAEILRYVLAANQSAGELERRRAELRQILKNAGYYNDPKPLERLGLRLISGRTHWKLQYANVRVTMSKTPSDYRANLNNGSEIANRCF